MSTDSKKLDSEWNSIISKVSIDDLSKIVDQGLPLKKIQLHGLSLLHLAAWHNRPDICDYLIGKGMDPNITEKQSQKTPLHIASYLGNMESVEALFRRGAEVLYTKKTVDVLGCHPMHYAAMSVNKEMIDFFLRIPNIDRFVNKRNLCSVRSLSRAGNVLDILIRKQNHALLEYYSPIGGPHAVETNPRLFSTLYVGYGNEHQWTPFHFAAILGDVKALKILLKHFPYASCLNRHFEEHYFFSPGEVALAEGYIEAARLLGSEEDVESYRSRMKNFHLRKGEPKCLDDLPNAVIDRNEKLIQDFLHHYGLESFSREAFMSPCGIGLTPLPLGKHFSIMFRYGTWRIQKRLS